MASIIPIEITQGYITLSAVIEGTPARLLLDTGADATVIDPKIAERLALVPISYHESGVAGGRKVRIPLVELKSIQVGNTTVSLKPVAVVDMNREERPFGRIDGVLGSDFIKQNVVTIDYPKRQLIFETSDSYKALRLTGVSFPLHLVGGTAPYLSVELDGKLKLVNEYKLDTGAAKTHLRLQDLESLGYQISKLKKSDGQSLGGKYVKVETRLQSMSIGNGISKQNFDVFAYSSKIGFIGADFFDQLRLSLNYERSEIVVTK